MRKNRHTYGTHKTHGPYSLQCRPPRLPCRYIWKVRSLQTKRKALSYWHGCSQLHALHIVNIAKTKHNQRTSNISVRTVQFFLKFSIVNLPYLMWVHNNRRQPVFVPVIWLRETGHSSSFRRYRESLVPGSTCLPSNPSRRSPSLMESWHGRPWLRPRRQRTFQPHHLSRPIKGNCDVRRFWLTYCRLLFHVV